MKRSHIDAYIMEQEGLTFLDRSALEQLQLRKLNHVLQRMRAHGQTRFPAHLETLADLANLPFTTAEDLAVKPSRYLLTSQGDVARIITDQTSGTTAQAKRVFYTAEDVSNTIHFFAAGISEMAQSGDTVLITMPFSGALGLGDLIKQAVEAAFEGVKVANVNTVNVKPKAKRVGRYTGFTSKTKKAIITLAADSKAIELFATEAE